MSDKKFGQIMDEFNKDGERLMNQLGTSLKSNRRGFVGALSALGATSLGMTLAKRADAAVVGPLGTVPRRDKAYLTRINQAHANLNAATLTEQATNGDEEQLSNKIGSYSKGLPHSSSNGAVNLSAYNSMINALSSGTHSAFESITLGGPRRLVNPQSGIAFEMEGGDGPNFRIPAPPKFNSREEAAEIAENYWMALLRDVPYTQYPSNNIANAAAADLTLYGSDAKVPKNASGQVTPDLLFRGLTPGDRVGPFIPQFFLLPCPFGQNFVEQRVFHPTAGVNFMTTWDSWLAIQNGQNPTSNLGFESVLRYMRNGRGLGEWVHVDVLFQAYFMAFLILESIGAPLDQNNPYNNSSRQIGFGTFGGPHVATLLCEVSTRALHATWWQKWFAHRRLRPEAFAGAIHARLFRGASSFPIHQEILNDLNSSSRLGGFLNTQALLPIAFAEGSPTHPAYTAGHATVAGACTTILKAWYDESAAIPNPVQPSTDGLSLQPFSGATLTVGGELNKIASVVGNARNQAGLHWRSDTTASLALGEAIAIQLMAEHRTTFNEPFGGFRLTKFNGQTVTV
jgi:hypothetical protein